MDIDKAFNFIIWLLVLLVVAVIVAGSIWWEWSLWGECRRDHSWLYCWRVLS